MDNLYVIHDAKAETYTQPACYINDATAERAVSNMASDPDHMFGSNPEDFNLYCVGTYDSDTAEIQSHAPRHICHLASVVRRTVDMFDPNQRDLYTSSQG